MGSLGNIVDGRGWRAGLAGRVAATRHDGLDACSDSGEPRRIVRAICVDRLARRCPLIGSHSILPNIIRTLTKAALLSVTLAAVTGSVFAQSGSAGGSIGNDEKSLSGSRATPRAAEPSRPARRSSPEAEAPSRASRKAAVARCGSLEGAWILRSVGATCASSTDAVVISSGKLVGQDGTGQVSPNGSVSGTGSAGGLSWTMSGRFSGRSGSGMFQRSDGCTGTWTGTKQ